MSLWRASSGADAMATAEQKMEITSSATQIAPVALDWTWGLTHCAFNKIEEEKEAKTGGQFLKFLARQQFKLATVKRWPTHETHTAASGSSP